MGDPSAVASCSKLRQIKRWLRKNLLLLVTVSGVFFGVVLGEYLPIFYSLNFNKKNFSLMDLKYPW